MYKQRTTDFIIGIEDQVLAHYGYEFTGNRHIDCPICQSKKSLRITEQGKHQAGYICKCGAGSIISLIMESQGREYADVCNEIDRVFGNQGDKPKIKKKPSVIAKFNTLERISGTMGEDYLNARGIRTIPEHGIRFNIRQFHTEEQHSNYSSLVSIATDHRGEPAKTHITHLQDGKKAGAPVRRLVTTGSKSPNVSIKMFDPQSCLGVGEGIETCLAATQIHSVPVWATLNTAILKNFRAPKGVKTLHIYADCDTHGAGLAAAFACGHSNLMCKNDVAVVYIRWPEKGDWNDFIHDPCRRFEQKLWR